MAAVRKYQRVKFTYKKLNGDIKNVDAFNVSDVFVSEEGHEIVSGFLDNENEDGRKYRAENMSDITVLDMG
jgi:hypothetical protein